MGKKTPDENSETAPNTRLNAQLNARQPQQRSDKRAIALKYDGNHAPMITAKGEDDLAREIMEIAEAFAVPSFQQSDLADLLFQLELNEEIPEALYVAVAEIISFAYMLAGKTPADLYAADVESD